jgi:hypothetical protein
MGPRTIDVDIGGYDDLALGANRIVLPHPKPPVPLGEIAPGRVIGAWRIDETGGEPWARKLTVWFRWTKGDKTAIIRVYART